MIVDVAVLPSVAVGLERKVCIVIDALRASASMVSMLEAGAPEVVLAATVDEARQLVAEARERYWLVGEVRGLPPPDFDYGNSPTQLRRADLSGRQVVFATSNGTRALAQLAAAAAIYVGGLPNASAVVARARDEALLRGLRLCIVCAGDEGGTLLSLEDLVSAGVLVELLVAGAEGLLLPDDPRAATSTALALDESAEAARRLYRSFLPTGAAPLPPHPGALAAAFAASRHARYLPSIGYAADVVHCQRADTSAVVPLLARRDERLAIVPASTR